MAAWLECRKEGRVCMYGTNGISSRISQAGSFLTSLPQSISPPVFPPLILHPFLSLQKIAGYYWRLRLGPTSYLSSSLSFLSPTSLYSFEQAIPPVVPSPFPSGPLVREPINSSSEFCNRHDGYYLRWIHTFIISPYPIWLLYKLLQDLNPFVGPPI